MGPAGGLSESTPTLNQVERRPSAFLRAAPSTGRSPSAVTAVRVVTRPDGFTAVRTSVTAPPRCSVRPSFAPVNGTGPQLWYGEMVSYGSGTETRYGTAVPQTSSADAVRPPDVEKKYVFATAPS